MWIVFARFICGIVLHVSLSGELTQGMTMMKYAVNHHWKFVDYRMAYFTGFLQTSVVVAVELVNFVALITNTTVLDIVMNFLALVVIADFDDFFFSAVKDSELLDVITEDSYANFLIYQTTTSWDADRNWMPENRITKQKCEEDQLTVEEQIEVERKAAEAEAKRDEKDQIKY